MNTKSKIMKAVSFAVVFALASSGGAARAWNMPKMFSLDNTWPFRDKDKPQEGIPVRMVGTWTDTVMTQGGQKPQRGFGGRLMFYDKDGKKPILVDGQLVVYAFDEAGRDPTDNKPTRRYVFPADQMPIHMSKCELGASYSFWLPWDEAGGPKTEVSLICRFEPKGGAVVTGEQTKHLLPGPTLPAGAIAGANKPPRVPEGVPSKPPKQSLEEILANRTDRGAQQISYESPAGSQQGAVVNATMQTGPMADRRLTATTIALPQNYQLPDAAALNAAMQSAGYQQSPPQMSQQLSPNAAQLQLQAAQARTYNFAAPAPLNQQQMAPAQPYMGTQMPQQMPAGPPSMFPGMQTTAQAPMGMNTMAANQMPQQYQQPIIPQPIMQPPPIRQPQPAMQSWPQAPNQFGQPATASYPPASVQYR